jgi:hypothetical protein
MRLSPWALSLALVAATLAARSAPAGSIQFLKPFGSSLGIAYGIDGQNVVGEDAAHRAFLYDGSTYKLIPSPSGGAWTPYDISGNKIVGNWGSIALLYENGNFTTINHPLAAYGTRVYGIDGNKIVGSFADGSKVSRGFLFDGSSYTTINYPFSTFTVANGVSGNNVVGEYYDTKGDVHGFLFDGATYTTLDDPLFMGAGYTSAFDIDGDNIVGYTSANAGALIASFIYDGSTYTHPFDVELEFMGGHHFRGISGNRIVGEYNDQPFIYTIPEPASLALALLAALALPLVRWRSLSRSSPA